MTHNKAHETTRLDRFEKRPTCQACRSSAVATYRFCAPGIDTLRGFGDIDCATVNGAHLHVTCRRCGCQKLMAVAPSLRRRRPIVFRSRKQ
jgi:hypothetical protein